MADLVGTSRGGIWGGRRWIRDSYYLLPLCVHFTLNSFYHQKFLKQKCDTFSTALFVVLGYLQVIHHLKPVSVELDKHFKRNIFKQESKETCRIERPVVKSFWIRKERHWPVVLCKVWLAEIDTGWGISVYWRDTSTRCLQSET